MKIKSAEFLLSVAGYNDLPSPERKEIAFLGRSNVGKSSLINCLLKRRNLARVGSSPGRTRTINLYLVNNRFHFVDLPGYGYAHVSKDIRKSWRKMVEEYLLNRTNIKLTVTIHDIRRDPVEEEMGLISWLLYHNISFITVLTKCDLVPAREFSVKRKLFSESIDVIPERVFLFSAKTNEGKKDLMREIGRVLLI